MTPIILWGLLTPGVLAAANMVMLAIAAKTATRVWRASAAGRPGPALVGASITGAFLYLSYRVMIGAGPTSVIPEGWEHRRITTGWEYYYAVALPALMVLWVALLVVFTAEALMVIGAGLAWLDKPSESPRWGAPTISNGRRLQRLWRMRNNEQRLARAITRHLDPTVSGPLRRFSTKGVIRTVRAVEATAISTTFELNTYGDGAELRHAHPALFDMLDKLIEHPHRSGIESMFLDAGPDAASDVGTARRRACLHVDWALEALDPSTRRFPVHLRHRPIETAVNGADPQ